MDHEYLNMLNLSRRVKMERLLAKLLKITGFVLFVGSFSFAMYNIFTRGYSLLEMLIVICTISLFFFAPSIFLIKAGFDLEKKARRINDYKHLTQTQQQTKTVKSSGDFFGKVLNFIGYLMVGFFRLCNNHLNTYYQSIFVLLFLHFEYLF